MSNGVYCLTSPSGKRYVGIGVSKHGNGIQRRWYSYRKLDCRDQPVLYAALLKYGAESFTYEVVMKTSDRSRAKAVECQLIALWGTRTKCGRGYNLTAGGDGQNGASTPKWSDERKAAQSLRMREWLAIHGNPMQGKKRPLEANRAAAEKMRGRPSGMLGKHHSEETRLRLSAARKGRPSWVRTGPSPSKRPVTRSDGECFPSVGEAASALGVTINSVSAVLHGRHKTCRGFTFNYTSP